MRETIISTGIEATQNLNGEIWECGTFRGDMATHMLKISSLINPKRIIRLFDTFSGMPFSDAVDYHQVGCMNDTNLEFVSGLFSLNENVHIHQGTMPDTFSGLENKIVSLVNIDVDNYKSTKDCLEFIYPIVHSSGYIILDDYNCGSCPGAKLAINEFLMGKSEIIRGGAGPQAYFIKN